jgi:two-component system response regulator HydG
MTASSGRLLVVDDDAGMCDMLERSLRKKGYEVATATSESTALEALHDQELDAVLTDLRLGEDSGIALCRQAAELRPDLPVIVITAFGSMDSAVAAMRAGAYDFITKPVDLEQLAFSVKRAVEHHELRAEVRRLRDAHSISGPVGELIGQSPAMRRVYDLIDRVSDSETSILITGESGTGKELVARALHNRSRREGDFVAVNCAAISAQLLESELFGHVQGAFTDAKTDREGLFIESSGGTLLLDEIGEMPLEMQSKLLRALQERKVRPVGGSREIEFDTRIIAATNKDIDEEVDRGDFREDLFYRINVVRISLPPLRARGNDVLLLAQHFLEEQAERSHKEVAGITPDAAAKLLEYDWPGNVRELENVMERAVTLTRFDAITVEDLPDRVREHESKNLVVASDDPDHLPTLDQLERRYVARVLKAVAGNKTQAAKVLGVDRRTLYRKLERYEQEDEETSDEASVQEG